MDECKFKVGDLVMVRGWDDMAKEYGVDEDGDIPVRCEVDEDGDITRPLFFIGAMKTYCNRVSVVKEIYNSNSTWYIVLESVGELFGTFCKFQFSQEMFELLYRPDNMFNNDAFRAVLDIAI